MTNDAGETTPAGERPDDAVQHDGENQMDDVKRKFREALAAKTKRDHTPVDDRPDQHFETHEAAGTKRVFRRKSGS